MLISLYVCVTVSKVNEPDAAPPCSTGRGTLSKKVALSNVQTIFVAVAVMANIRATEPTNSFVSVLIVAKEASTPRCGAVVEVMRKSIRDLLSAEGNTECVDGARGCCGLGCSVAVDMQRKQAPFAHHRGQVADVGYGPRMRLAYAYKLQT